MRGEHSFDLIDMAHLVSAGSLKWSHYPASIGAWVAEMDFGTAPEVTRALQQAVQRGSFGYLPAGLSTEMSQACADWHRNHYGWDVGPDRVHPIADVIKGLGITIEHYSRPGSPVIVPTPAYMPFLVVPPELGRDVIEVPVLPTHDGFEMDLDGLHAAFRAGGHLLVLCNPYNPLGKVFSADELRAISAVVARHGGRVFSDEIHSPLIYPGARHVPYASLSATAAAHTVTATSASKAWNLPGLKCAQLLLSNDDDAASFEQIRFSATHGASTLGVIANKAAYTDGGPWLQGVLGYLDRNRRLLADLVEEHLPGVRYHLPQGTYIGWLDCRELDLDGPPAAYFLEHAGVALTDGAACGAAGQGSVRLVFATPAPVLTEAVRRMGAALQSRRTRPAAAAVSQPDG